MASSRTGAGPPRRAPGGPPAVPPGAPAGGTGRAARTAQRVGSGDRHRGRRGLHPQPRDGRDRDVGHHPEGHPHHRESFAAALGQGLADQHAVLALHPEKLRWLDRVDALLVDPRVLCTDTLRVVRVRGADEDELTPAWNRAQLLLEKKGLRVGWHPVPGLSGKGSDAAVEALIGPTHDPLASAVLAEARRAGLELISVGVDDLGELQPAFDELRPLQRASIDYCAGRGADRSAAVGPHRRGRVFGWLHKHFRRPTSGWA